MVKAHIFCLAQSEYFKLLEEEFHQRGFYFKFFKVLNSFKDGNFFAIMQLVLWQDTAVF